MAEAEILERKVTTIFIHSVMKTLSGMGESVQTAVLYHIEQIRGMPYARIIRNPLMFVSTLRTIFSSGSGILEEKIIENMCGELGMQYEKITGSFEDKLLMIYEREQMIRGSVGVSLPNQTVKYDFFG